MNKICNFIMAKDYYKILGVAKNASAEDIKKAYRVLALKYHPDRGGDSEKFKEVNEAYQVLSNPQKRAQFDQFGTTSDQFGAGNAGGGGYYSNFNFEDIFSGGAGGGFDFSNIFEGFFGNAFAQVNVQAEITLIQAILGDEVSFRIETGEIITLKIPSGTQDGQTFRFRGKGMAHRRGRGDLIVTVKIKFPRRLNRRQRELFEELKRTGL